MQADMMDIIVNGEFLDVKDNGTTLQFTKPRFAGGDSFADTFSTDIELPRSNKNIAILGCNGLLDSPSPKFIDFVKCTLVTSTKNYTCNMMVTEVTDESICVSLFLSSLVGDMLDKKVVDALIQYEDEQYGYFDNTLAMNVLWAKATASATDVDYGFKHYDADWYDALGTYRPHPCCKVRKILDYLELAYGIDIDTSASAKVDTLYITPAKRVLSPKNHTQCLFVYVDENENTKIYGGSHVTNDMSCSIDDCTLNGVLWNFTGDGKTSIKFNRACTISMQIKVMNGTASQGTIQVKKNNVFQYSYTFPAATGSYDYFERTIGNIYIAEGDEITFVPLSGTPVCRSWINMSISGYEVNNDDYSKTFNYIPAQFKTPDSSDPSYITNHDYSEYSVRDNLGDFTIRQLLSAISAATNLYWKNENDFRIVLVPATRTESIQLTKLNSIKFSNSDFARNNIIGFADDNAAGEAVITLDNVDMEESTKFFESYFACGQKKGDSQILHLPDGYSKDVIAQIGTSQKTLLNYLKNTTMGINISSITQIEAETLCSVIDCDYVTIDGKSYLVIDGELDTETGITKFNAIKAKKDNFLRPVIGILDANLNKYSLSEWNALRVKPSAFGTYMYIDEIKDYVVIGAVASGRTYGRNPAGIVVKGVTTALTSEDALKDFSGVENTGSLILGMGSNADAAKFCRDEKKLITSFTGYMPSCGELLRIFSELNDINLCRQAINQLPISDKETYLTSTICDVDNCWVVDAVGMEASTKSTEDSNYNTLEISRLSNFLCFTANENGCKVGMNHYGTNASGTTPTIYKSADGIHFELWNYSDITLSNAGDKVYMYGENWQISSSDEDCSEFEITGSVAVSGDVTTLLDISGHILSLAERDYCFFKLFNDCAGITIAPELPSITLEKSCYEAMFKGCTALQKAPILPASQIESGSYNQMFYGCISLNEIIIGASSWNTENTTNWVYRVAARGTFSKLSATSIPKGSSGIPTGIKHQCVGLRAGTKATIVGKCANSVFRLSAKTNTIDGWEVINI